MTKNKRIQITLAEDVSKDLEEISEQLRVAKSVVITLALNEFKNNLKKK